MTKSVSAELKTIDHHSGEADGEEDDDTDEIIRAAMEVARLGNQELEEYSKIQDEYTEFEQGFLSQFWVQFAPVLVVWPLWITILARDHVAWGDVFQYWPLTVGMVFGSFLAGATPIGGGVVAYPISVLILDFTSAESRDAAVLVQSVSLTAASFLLIVTKTDLLDSRFIIINVIFGNVGMLLGVSIDIPSDVINMMYTLLIFEFGILYLYQNHIALPLVPTPKERSCQRIVAAYVVMIIFAFCGGFMTGNVGSGSDIALYAYGMFVWNKVFPEQTLSDNSLTACTVVVMAALSIFMAALRALEGGFTSRTVEAWGAMAFIVVLMAPVGALLLTPAMLPFLRWCFYVLAFAQLFVFGAVEIGGDYIRWTIVIVVTMIMAGVLLLHYRHSLYKLASEQNASERVSAVVSDVGAPACNDEGEDESEVSDLTVEAYGAYQSPVSH